MVVRIASNGVRLSGSIRLPMLPMLSSSAGMRNMRLRSPRLRQIRMSASSR